MGWLWQDLSFGFRTLRKDHALIVASVAALGLGIGSTTAMFSVIDHVLVSRLAVNKFEGETKYN
ncbi:MAG TPA: hypothetical protein VMR62_24565 [Bryobacteraceae bacterium]|jgi:hypothetical protein|nr:hypothetical protein [Bryobacteraceae bacterium]